MRIALGTDHAGYLFKEKVRAYLAAQGHEVQDFGAHTPESSDYPDFVGPASLAVSEGRADLAVVFGGSGNGEAMVANRIRGIRCGVCWNQESARLTKRHNNANVISIGARLVPEADLLGVVEAWLKTTYEGGRHDERLHKLHTWEGRGLPSQY